MSSATGTAQSPVRAINAYCLDSCDHTRSRSYNHGGLFWTAGFCVNTCERPDCPLYPYRLGTNPNRKGIGGRPRQK